MKRTRRTLINLGKKWGHVVPLQDLRDIRRIKVFPDGRVGFCVWGNGDRFHTSLHCFKQPESAVRRLMNWQEIAEKEMGPGL